MNEEFDLKRKLVEATNAIRKKYKLLRSAKTQSAIDLEKFYEPISKPISTISNAVQQQLQQRQQSTTKPIVKVKKQSCGANTSLEPTESPFTMSFDSTPVAKERQTPYYTPFPPNQSSGTPDTSTVTSSPTKETADYHLNGLKIKPSLYDNVYGVRMNRKKTENTTYIGNLEVRFPPGQVTFYDQSKLIATFEGSPALYELIFLKYPSVLGKEEDLNKNVIENYKDILNLTNAAYKYYDKSRGLLKTRWAKYLRIIKPIMADTKLGAAIKRQTNANREMKLPKNKRLSPHSPEYVYWNKPKELIDRLRLLWSSKAAGHTGHDNEIMSIIEELREEGIIY